MSRTVRWCLGISLLVMGPLAWGEQCIQRANDLEKISSEALSLFGPGWRSYLPMPHDPQVHYKSATSPRPKYPEFFVQRNALGLLEVKVGGETYQGQICATEKGLRLDVLILGGLMKGDSVELRPSKSPGEIIIAYQEKPMFQAGDDNGWSTKPVTKEWLYAIEDFDQGMIASTKSGFRGPRASQ
ncbi:MAG: hypothetical protein H6624_02565 [Bdellovibrionaceae bacterium]|nr:hypothetical protein [Bdellovibrionales bacterium]MCB9083194.1 hypothetical protein [Pseudobdellovibrionaceae bacterium]